MTSLLVFNRVYRLEIKQKQSFWYFRPALCTFAPLTFSLVSSPPSPLPCVNKYIVYTVYAYTVCKRGGSTGSLEGRGPQTDKTPAAKSLYKFIFLDNNICHCILYIILIFLWDKLTLRKIYVAFNWDWAENNQFSCKLLTFIKNVAVLLPHMKMNWAFQKNLNLTKWALYFENNKTNLFLV
jgi:hypothetical protein